jgi:hypothetical protein
VTAAIRKGLWIAHLKNPFQNCAGSVGGVDREVAEEVREANASPKHADDRRTCARAGVVLARAARASRGSGTEREDVGEADVPATFQRTFSNVTQKIVAKNRKR